MGIRQSKEEQLYQASQLGNHQLVKSLRRDGASLEWIDKEGRTPLLLACTRAERFDMVETLLNLGANINAYRPGAHGGFPLHHAAKRGIDKTVLLLLTKGADPLLINDDGKTPLDTARVRGHPSTVRLIEEHICLFSGALREIYGPGFLEVLAPQWVTRKIWAVVLPSESKSRRRPPRYQLVIYSSSKVAQPRLVISLIKAVVDEPKFCAPNPVLNITDTSTKGRFKFLSETDGDKQQLERFYNACTRGIHQLDEDLPMEQTLQGVSAVTVQPPSGPVNTGQGSAIIPAIVLLGREINASLQFASLGLFPGSTQGCSEANNCRRCVNVPQGSCNGCGAPALNPRDKHDYGGLADERASTNNGWGYSEAGPSVSHSSTNTHSIVPASSISAPEAELPSAVSSVQAISAPSTTPSAPPFPSEDTPSVTESHPVDPSIDVPPVQLNHSDTYLTQQPPAAKENANEKAGSMCVVCWESPAEAVCIPCGHLAGCMECLVEIKLKNWGCPICRAEIDKVVKVYRV